MVPFGIYLRYFEIDGYICPDCGFWKYDKKKIKQENKYESIRSFLDRVKTETRYARVSMER